MTGFQPASGGIVEHESALERDFVALVRFIAPDAAIAAQPVTIRFEHEGAARRYTRDFLISSPAGSRLVEVKYRTDLKREWTRLGPAFAAARLWAAENGARFGIATEHVIRGPRLDAAKRLLPLRNAEMDASLAAIALAKASEGSFKLAELVESLPASREAALAVTWRLIARGALAVDFSRSLGWETPVKVV